MKIFKLASTALIAAVGALTLASATPAEARIHRHHHWRHHHHHHNYVRHHRALYVHVRHRYHHRIYSYAEPFGGMGSGAVIAHRGGGTYYDPRYGHPNPFGTYHRYAYRTYYYK